MDDELSRRLRANAAALRRDILDLVAIPSVSTDRPACRKALAAFLELARRQGLETSLEAGGDVGIAEYGPGLPADAETLGILAHVDVVEPGELSAWSRSPWGESAEGAIWGRGVQDDKGPLIMCLHGVAVLAELGVRFKRRVRFVVGTMEEVDWEDIRLWLKSGTPPDFGFTPDGEFPVVNREKGICDMWLRFDRVAVSALGELTIDDIASGGSVNSVPDTARAILSGKSALGDVQEGLAALGGAEAAKLSVSARSDGRVELLARGKAIHSSMPERGDNALIRLCSFLARLGPNPLCAFVAENFGGDHKAASLGLQTKPDSAMGEYIGPSTASPDVLRVEGGSVVLGVDVRTAYGQTFEELSQAFDAAARRYGFTPRYEPFLPAILVSRDRPFLPSLLAAYERRSGGKGDYLCAPGTSYAKALRDHVAFGPILPGMEDLCHMPDERMSFEDIQTCAEIYADAVGDIVSR